MNVRRRHGGHDDGEEDEAKMGFIFQINEHGFGTQLHEEKGQNKGPNHIDYLTLPFLIQHSFYLGSFYQTCDSHVPPHVTLLLELDLDWCLKSNTNTQFFSLLYNNSNKIIDVM